MIGRYEGSVPGSLEQAHYNLGSLVALVYVFLLILGRLPSSEFNFHP